MGHGQRVEDANLGLGWLYYALGRIVRPRTAVVIGSFRGFVPLVLARALADNAEGGLVHFIDPSMVDDFWNDPAMVREHFASFGVTNVRHYLMTTQEFAESPAMAGVDEIGLLFVDGFHTEEQAAFDHALFAPRMTDDGIALFHDSIRDHESDIYGKDRTYRHTVMRYMDRLKRDPAYQVMDFPMASGVTLVRRASSREGGR
jgi:predicted O-methyltransferase YrrM